MGQPSTENDRPIPEPPARAAEIESPAALPSPPATGATGRPERSGHPDRSGHPERSEGSRWTRRAVPLAATVIALATLAAYANSFQGVFVLDDETSIVNNPTIRHLWPIWRPLSPPSHGETVSGRPLLNLTFAINYALGGLNPWGYHAVNLAIHILAALTLFGILRRTFLLPSVLPLPSRERAGVSDVASSPNTSHRASATTSLAFAIALLWAVHPLQTESVTYIVQRAESLCGLFYLLTLYCVIRGSTSGTNPPSAFRRPPSAFRWYSAAFLACLLGMATKEVMITAPFVVLLYDRTFLAGSFAEALRRRWGLYLGLAATWGLLAYLVLSTGLLGKSAGYGAPDAIGAWEYLRSQPAVTMHYLRLSLWPDPLCLDYGRTGIVPTLTETATAGIVVGLLAATTVWALVRHKDFAVLSAWFFLTLAPTSLTPLHNLAFEHRIYLALAAVATAVMLAVCSLGKWLAHRASYLLPASDDVGVFLATLLCLVLGVLAFRRNADYRSEIAMWQETVTKTPHSDAAHFAAGATLQKAGRPADAITQYERALELNPRYAEAHQNLGVALDAQGRNAEATAHYQKALELDPSYPQALNSMGNAMLKQRRLSEAIAQFNKALEIRPDYAMVHNDLGLALEQQGKFREAKVQYQKAIEIDEGLALAQCNLGNAAVRDGNFYDAIAHYEKAVQADPRYSEAHNNLGNTLMHLGRLSEAVDQYERALEINPRYAEAQNNLGVAFYKEGKIREALARWRETIRLQPNALVTLNRLAWALATHPDASVRDGNEAVVFARRATELCSARDPAVLDTLGAAYAEIGRFSDAVRTAEQALTLAEGQRNPALAEKIAARVKLYQASKNYRDAR